MNLPSFADTSALWRAEERVFKGIDKPSDLKKFALLVASIRFFQGKSNLTIRYDVATGDADRGRQAFADRCHWGYFSEGFSYMLNCLTAFEWSPKCAHFAPEVRAMIANYARIADPKGRVAMNDTRETDLIPLDQIPTMGYRNPCYTVLRPRPGVFILIHHNVDVANGGPHVNPDIFGHVVAMVDGVDVLHHPWYLGYEDKQKHPPRYNTIYNFQRWFEFGKPKLSVERTDYGLILRMGDARRRISLNGRGIFWLDTGPGQSFQNAVKSARSGEVRF